MLFYSFPFTIVDCILFTLQFKFCRFKIHLDLQLIKRVCYIFERKSLENQNNRAFSYTENCVRRCPKIKFLIIIIFLQDLIFHKFENFFYQKLKNKLENCRLLKKKGGEIRKNVASWIFIDQLNLKNHHTRQLSSYSSAKSIKTQL